MVISSPCRQVGLSLHRYPARWCRATTASSAWTSGLAARVLSSRSRRSMSAATGAAVDRRPSSPARRWARISARRGQEHLRAGRSARPPSRCRGPRPRSGRRSISARCAATSSARTAGVGRDRADGAGDLGASGSRRRPARRPAARRRCSGRSTISMPGRLDHFGRPNGVLGCDPGAQYRERGGAVHRAGVEVAGAEPAWRARGPRSTCRCRTVRQSRRRRGTHPWLVEDTDTRARADVDTWP